MRKLWPFIVLFFITLPFLSSCKKNMVEEQYTPIIDPVIPDFSTQVNASVNGFITDENGNAVAEAIIKGGTVTVSTNQYGYFQIPAASFAKSAGFIQVSKDGYFTGYRTFLPVEGKQSFIRLQLIPKTVTGSVESGIGGTVTTLDGATVTLPANGVVRAEANAAYNGIVQVAVHWLNPVEENKTQLTMPGNLTGVDSAGNLTVLVTYGMLAVELSGSNGELLQMAPGKKATLHFPLPSSLSGIAPFSIPLWYFDETKGVWQQQGSAVKNGNQYEGEVSHFSFWNCDMGLPLVSFTAQIIDSALNPISNSLISVSIDGMPNTARSGYTNAEGIINGQIPANSNLSISLVNSCASIIIKSFSTLNSNIDMGTITTPANPFIITIRGHVNRCSGAPVNNGNVIIALSDLYHIATINPDGSFAYTSNLCTNANAYLKAIDWDSSVVSLPFFFTTTIGTNEVGTITACTPSTNQSLVYSFDGNTTLLTTPQYLFSNGYNIAGDMTTIVVTDLLTNTVAFRLDLNSASSTGQQSINQGSSIAIVYRRYSITNPSIVTIQEYGLVGQFIRGNINGQVQNEGGVGPVHPFSCTFNVKRDY